MADDEHSIDLVRDALQVHVNEVGADAGNGGWLVAHWVAVMGLYRINEDGTTETRPVLTAPLEQADYITDGLVAQVPELLDMCKECEDSDGTLGE
jgi:hypothetical protein